MLRLFTDFQAVDSEGYCWILRRDARDSLGSIDDLNLAKGDKVVLDPCEDFEVVGALDFRFVPVLGRDACVALPDWSTRAEKPASLRARDPGATPDRAAGPRGETHRPELAASRRLAQEGIESGEGVEAGPVFAPLKARYASQTKA